MSEPGERRVDVMAFQNFGLLMVKLVRWKSAKKRLQVLLACVHTRALAPTYRNMGVFYNSFMYSHLIGQEAGGVAWGLLIGYVRTLACFIIDA